IQSGFGRTGAWSAFEQFGVVPDISTWAKSLGSGMPIAAVMGRAEIMDKAAPSSIGGTYIGNPVSCAAALATLKYMEAIDIYPWVDMVLFSELCAYGPLIANAQQVPGEFEQQMCAMAAKHGIWLLPGSIFEKKDDKIYNTATVIDPEGSVVARYRKMFPFYP